MSVLRSRALLAAGMSTSLLVGLAVADSSAATSPEAAALEILPPDAEFGGATRGEWEARSVQWGMSMPADANSQLDAPTRCGLGQSGPVFFLQFGVSGFTCVVAEGTAIYVSALASLCSTVEGFEAGRFFGRTEEELRACTAKQL